MASPQKENGYTAIANEILEQVSKFHLNGTQYSIILTVWRFTYGFQRKEHDMSIAFIANATGITSRAIKKELKILIDRNILLITKENTNTKSRIMKFNKDYESWLEGNKTTPLGVGNNRSPGEQNDPSGGEQTGHLEGNKTTPKKESKENSKESIYIVFHHWNSKKIITHKTLTDKISGHINARLEEGYSVEEIIEAIDNYETILKDNVKYFWSYKWGLSDFLIRGLDKFKTESDPFKNYANKSKPLKGQAKSPREHDTKFDHFYNT